MNSLLAEGTHSCFQICKNIEIHQDFPELWSQMYCLVFNESQYLLFTVLQQYQ